MEKEIDLFIYYLHNSKKTSHNTELSYRRDLNKLIGFLKENNITELASIKVADLKAYIIFLENNKLSAATISRNIASLKTFFVYLCKEDKIKENIARLLKAPKIEKKIPVILSSKEISKLLEQPKANNPKEIRDKAMLELLYATGIRVSELIGLQLENINLQMDYIICKSRSKSLVKERIIPFGAEAKNALIKYLKDSRPVLIEDKKSQILFTNCSGLPMSRQGFWKIIKCYAQLAGITCEITPNTFRHSFAAHLVANGADIKMIQEMLGHSDIAATLIYSNFSRNRISEVYHKAHPRG